MPSKQNQAVITGIVLITLLLCAYFLAQGSMGLLAHRLFSGTTSDTAALPGGAHIDVRRETKSNEAIITRNIFGPDVSLEPVEAAEELELELGEDGELVLPEDGILTRCDGGVRLVAAVVNPKNTALSVAGLADGADKATLYREGMSVDGKYIVAISPHRVILQSSGRLCEVPMWRADESEAPRTTPASVAEAIKRATEARANRPTPSDRNAGLSGDEMSSGIEKVDDEHYKVNRDIFDKLLEDPSALGGLARGIAHEENGQVVGMKLYGIRRTALLGRLGVQNGDMLRTVNGFEVANLQSDADAALNALTALRGSNKVSVSVIRRGKPVTLEYTVN